MTTQDIINAIKNQDQDVLSVLASASISVDEALQQLEAAKDILGDADIYVHYDSWTTCRYQLCVIIGEVATPITDITEITEDMSVIGPDEFNYLTDKFCEVVHTDYINLFNEQSLTMGYCDEETASQLDAFRELCVFTDRYYDWRSEATIMCEYIYRQCGNVYGEFHMDTLVANLARYKEEWDEICAKWGEPYMNSPKTIEEIIAYATSLSEEEVGKLMND